jgi:hypothetical protein
VSAAAHLVGRRFQRQSSLWDRHLIRGTDLFHDVLTKEVEDLQLAVERRDEPLIWLNPPRRSPGGDQCFPVFGNGFVEAVSRL